jgi:diguanylate cyclase (GGDEF)-like protein/PAS domain S-box-containing protein
MPSQKKKPNTRTYNNSKGQKRYQDLLEHLPIGVYRTTPTGEIIEANVTLIKMLGYENLAELKEINVKNLYVKSKDRTEHLKRLDTSLVNFAEFEIRCRDGSTIWCRDYPRAHKGPSGKIDFYDGILVDITPQKKTEKKLRKALQQLARSIKERKTMIAALESLTLEDPLTGLYNRRGFTTIATEYLKLAARKKENMFLLYIDLDDLKKTNDSFGHAQGDEMLLSLAEILLATFRKSDIKARIGGDEFAVFPIDTQMAGARTALSRLKKKIKEHNKKSGRPPLLSISTGIARYNPGRPNTIEELLGRADTKMYEEKRRKQNSG